jgi:hypothetical protein
MHCSLSRFGERMLNKHWIVTSPLARYETGPLLRTEPSSHKVGNSKPSNEGDMNGEFSSYSSLLWVLV